jgi:outer membrane protein
MKKMKSLFVAIMLVVGATGFLNAQTKVAHIDTQALAEAMPEMREAQSQLEKLQKTYTTEIRTLQKEIEAKLAQYQAEVEAFSPEENVKRAEEIQGMETNVRAYQQSAGEDLQKKQQTLFGPIQEKMILAIQKVGRAQGYQYVMDSSTLLLAEGKDLLVDVKKELGI